MSEEEESECRDCWFDFAKGVANALGGLEENKIGKASVILLGAIENLIDQVHNCPPGMIGLHWTLRPVPGRTTSVAEMAEGEPIFHIDPAADLMDVPPGTQEETLKTIRESWSYVETSLAIWSEHLSEVEEEDRPRRIKMLRVIFTGCVFLRSWGLWHAERQPMPKKLRATELPDAFEFFCNVNTLNDILRGTPGIKEYHFFNMTGEWPEKD